MQDFPTSKKHVRTAFDEFSDGTEQLIRTYFDRLGTKI